MSSDPGASVMLQVVRRGHACGEAGARVWRGGGTRVLLIFQCVLFSFQTFGGSAQMLGENKEISAGG